MAEIGNLLRETRESQGLSLEKVEEITRIRRVFLEALEEERFEDLPGDAYARGFLRNYGRVLGLDPERLIAEYRSVTNSYAQDSPAVLDEPLMRTMAPRVTAAIFVALAAILVVVVAGWYIYSRVFLDQDPWPIRAAGPVASASVTPSATEPAVVIESTDTPTRRFTPRPTRTMPPTPTSLANPVIQPTETERPTPVVRPRTPTPTITIAPTRDEYAGVVVEAQVRAETYVRAVADGDLLMERILAEGEDQVWRAEETISLRIGNAAGLALTVNGVEVGPLGEPGQVVTVEYNLGNLPQG